MILAYCRVSTVEQASSDKTSMSEQQRIVKGVAMAKGLSGYDVAVYNDPGVSGAIALNQRPAGKRMLEDAKPGDVICAAKLDRLFRSASDALSTVEVLKKRGIDLILVDMGIEPVTSNGVAKLFFGMLSLVAEFEKERITERMTMGRKGKQAAGGHLGGDPPYGFKVVGKGHSAKLEPNEDEQRVIALIEELTGQQRMAGVVKTLREKQIYTRSGKPFAFQQVKRIMQRENMFH